MSAQALMARTLEMAAENARSGRGGPFAALVVRAGEVLAEGVNRVTELHDPTAHAEIVALREACRKLGDFQLTGCEIYASCEPCPMCLGAIYWARAERIYFSATRYDAAAAGFDDSAIYDDMQAPMEQRRIAMVRLTSPGAGRPFQEWKLLAGRAEY